MYGRNVKFTGKLLRIDIQLICLSVFCVGPAGNRIKLCINKLIIDSII